MKRLVLTCVLTCLLTGCSRSGKVGRERLAFNTPASNSRAFTAEPSQRSALQNQVSEIAALAKGHVGVSAVLLETAETVAALNRQDRFPMQSVYKLPISMAVLKQVDVGKLTLEQKVAVSKSDFVGAGQHSPIRDRNPNGAEITISELIRFAIAESDGTASDVLMKLAGGPQAVQAYLNDLSANEWIVLNTEKEIGEDWRVQYRNFSTPDAAVALLRALHEKRGLSESSQALVLKYLIESTPGAKRLKGLLPAGMIVAHKTGTSGDQKGITAATNDIGIITLPNGKHLAIAVFVSDSPADEATREGVIAKLSKSIVDSIGQ